MPSAHPTTDIPALPVLCSARLLLRAFQPGDAADLARIGGSRAVADTTISVPHPLEEAGARDWIATDLGVTSHLQQVFAVTLAVSGALVGCVALKHIEVEHRQAELSFWFDPEQWGQGYAYEAAARLIEHAFAAAGMRRLVAYFMVRNRSSGRLLEKLGFRQEGLLRERIIKWGVLEDVIAAALLAPRPPAAPV